MAPPAGTRLPSSCVAGVSSRRTQRCFLPKSPGARKIVSRHFRLPLAQNCDDLLLGTRSAFSVFFLVVTDPYRKRRCRRAKSRD